MLFVRSRLAFSVVALLCSSCVDAPSHPRAATPSPSFDISGLTPDRVVVPTGKFPEDVANVQAAVDLGGTILLRAANATGVPTAFNFGPPISGSGRVVVGVQGKDVTLVGENVAGQVTTISGGINPIRAFNPVRLGVRGVFFDGPAGGAVLLFAGTGFEFTHSKVRNVTPLLYFVDPILGPIFKGQGVWVDAEPPEAVSGPITIEDNVFENCGISGAQLGYGLSIATGTGVTRVARNRITGANLAGIYVPLPTADVIIEDNTILPGPGDAARIDFGSGVFVNGSSAIAHVVFTGRDNEISIADPRVDGILVADTFGVGQAATTVLERNHVSLDAGFAGIELSGSVVSARVSQNKIGGTARYALAVDAVAGLPAEQAVGNFLQGNNISLFHAQVADVFFDVNTVDNVLVGNSGTVIDMGRGNRITGNQVGAEPHVSGRTRAIELLRRAPRGHEGVMDALQVGGRSVR